MSESNWKIKAKKAEGKKAAYGVDLGIGSYGRKAKAWPFVSCLSELKKEIQEKAFFAGVKADEEQRSGSYFQLDHTVVFEKIKKQFKGKIEIMSTTEARKKYKWMKKYWWNALQADVDKYTSLAELKQDHGYFFRVLKNVKLTMPLQACLFLSQNISQNVHNVVIAEEGSNVNIITGCLAAENIKKGLHVGITEFFIKKNASLNFTMIHRWQQNMDVRPRAAAILEENANFINNYVCLNPVKSLQLYPTAYLNGKNSKASFNSIVLSSKNSDIDIGAKALLNAKGTKAQIITRAVAYDKSIIHARGMLQGNVEECKAHLDCRGLLLSNKARIHAIPELEARAQGCELSHEAAIGKIKEEELYYLMSRGLNEEQATSLIVKGYLDPSIMGLPKELEQEIKKVIETTAKKVL